MASLKEIKTRIASVKNTLKITSAMKLVASAKLHKAQTAIENLHPYEQRLNEMVSRLIQADSSADKSRVGKLTRSSCSESSPAGQTLNSSAGASSSAACKRVAIVAISSSASLCGGFNNNLIRLTQHVIDEYTGQGSSVLLIPIGHKVAQAFAVDEGEVNVSIESGYVSIGEKPAYADASALSRHLTDIFLRGEVDEVEFLYTHYKNMAVQVLMRKQFLPIQVDNGQADPSAGSGAEGASSTESSSLILEPSVPELLDRLLPQALAMRLYAILLDSSAAEHAARTFAMQTATDNGDGLLQELNLQYNKVRQQSITNELLDIVGGQMR